MPSPLKSRREPGAASDYFETLECDVKESVCERPLADDVVSRDSGDVVDHRAPRLIIVTASGGTAFLHAGAPEQSDATKRGVVRRVGRAK